MNYMKVPETPNEWIEFLVRKRAVPIWADDVEGSIYFRRLRGPTSEAEKLVYGKHILGKKTRLHVARVLGITSKEECKGIREMIKNRICARERER